MSTHVTDWCIVLFCIQFRIQQTRSLWHLQNVHRKSASLNGKHQMETFSALLALCEGNPPVTGGFPLQRPVGRSFAFFICAWTNGWANNRDASELIHNGQWHGAMIFSLICAWPDETPVIWDAIALIITSLQCHHYAYGIWECESTWLIYKSMWQVKKKWIIKNMFESWDIINCLLL